MNLSKKHNISRNIILSFAGLLLCLFAVDYYWSVITKVVNKSYMTHPYNSNSSLDVRLNHANTYYWYARYRKNSQPEFLRSKAIVEEILHEIPDSMRVFPNRKSELEIIKNQALFSQLIYFCIIVFHCLLLAELQIRKGSQCNCQFREIPTANVLIYN